MGRSGLHTAGNKVPQWGGHTNTTLCYRSVQHWQTTVKYRNASSIRKAQYSPTQSCVQVNSTVPYSTVQ